MIYCNHIISEHNRTVFDVIANACWCVLGLLERDYPCYQRMYGDPEYPEDGPCPRSNPNVEKLGSSENPKEVLECALNILRDGIKEASAEDLSHWGVKHWVKWRDEGWKTNEEWEKYIKQ